MKKVTRNIAIILTVLWGILLGKGILSCVTYQPEPGASGMELLDQAIIGALCIFLAGGTFCSGMLAIAMHKFRNAWYYNLGGVERASLVTAVLCNVLLYVSYFFLFFTNSILTVLVPIAWVISSFVCFCLLVGAFCQVPPQEISQ